MVYNIKLHIYIVRQNCYISCLSIPIPNKVYFLQGGDYTNLIIVLEILDTVLHRPGGP